MRFIFRIACGTVVLVFGLSRLLSAQEQSDPTALLRIAVEKLTEAKKSKMRFTYLDANRTVNFDDKGRVTADYSQVFEVTYIADLQYARLVRMNGLPLPDDMVEEEQKRYDKAVRERAELDDKARAKIEHQTFLDAGVDIASLTTDYRNTVLGREMVGEVDCLVIDSTPLSDGQHKHYREWLDTAEGRMVRLRFDQISDEGDMLQGGSGVLLWTFIDGVPLMSEVRMDANVKSGKKHLRVVTNHSYTRYRKFSVSTKIMPAEPVEKQ